MRNSFVFRVITLPSDLPLRVKDKDYTVPVSEELWWSLVCRESRVDCGRRIWVGTARAYVSRMGECKVSYSVPVQLSDRKAEVLLRVDVYGSVVGFVVDLMRDRARAVLKSKMKALVRQLADAL